MPWKTKGNYDMVYDWDATQGLYLRSVPWGAHVLADGQRVTTDNVLVIKASQRVAKLAEGAGAPDPVHEIIDASGQMLYFTAGEKEVRTWMLRQGGTALEAAANIHTDLARGFIRAEVMSCPDLVRLGSEREIKAQGLVRQEPKDYVIRDGDILNIRFSV